MGVHWKILFLGGFMKNQYIGGLHKGGAWTVCRLKKGAWPKRGRVFLWRVATPMHTMGEVGGMGGFKIWGDLSNGGLILKWGGVGGGQGGWYPFMDYILNLNAVFPQFSCCKFDKQHNLPKGCRLLASTFFKNRNVRACVRYFLTIFYLLPYDSPSKTMKDVFYFI